MSKQSYSKSHLSTDEQITLLKSRGMLFHNENQAKKSLLNINYYRLSGYWLPFKKSDDIFILSQFMSNIKNISIKNAIAGEYKLETGELNSIMYHLSLLRNSIAHHSRVYNKVYNIPPKIPKKIKSISNQNRETSKTGRHFLKTIKKF